MVNKFYVEQGGTLPTRGTPKSAGYDFYTVEDVVIPAHSHKIIDTGVRIQLEDNLYLQLAVRSSIGKRGIILSNGIGVIDADYFQTGETIKGMLYNTTDEDFDLNKGDRFMQGIVLPYFKVGNDSVRLSVRTGGLGSTNVKV